MNRRALPRVPPVQAPAASAGGELARTEVPVPSVGSGQSHARRKAEGVVGHGSAVVTALTFASRFPGLDPAQLSAVITERLAALHAGRTEHIESTLMLQATALDFMFHDMAAKAAKADGPQTLDLYLRLALKAQAQSRATLQALADIKNPRQVAFVTQANIAHGAQQVNVTSRAASKPGGKKRAR